MLNKVELNHYRMEIRSAVRVSISFAFPNNLQEVVEHVIVQREVLVNGVV